MKKLILIPSLAIASSLPLLCSVSCATTRRWKLKDGPLEWKHKQSSGSVGTKKEATNKYFNEISNKILADDLIKKPIDRIVADSAVTEASITAKVSKIDKKEHRLTFSLDSEIVKSSNYGLTEQHAKSHLDFVNFPMELQFKPLPSFNDAEQYGWCVMAISNETTSYGTIVPTVYRNDPKWSFSCDLISDEHTLNGTINSTTVESEETEDLIRVCFSTTIWSYYFDNVEWNS